MLEPEKIISLFNLSHTSRNGDELVCSCPYTGNHMNGDRHPSFGISLSKGVYHCLGCGESGTLVKLAEDILGVGRLEALNLINTEFSIDDVQRIFKDGEYVPHVMTPVERDISAWCPNSHPYWQQRGFTEETIGHWRLGYDPADNRVVVPVYVDHELYGWTKRRIDEVSMPKWKHSEGLDRRHMLFGVDELEGDYAILVEAPLSVVMLWQQGIGNAVASFGCEMSLEQADILRRRVNRVLVFYDPDMAGVKGTANAIRLLADYLDVYAVKATRDDPAAMSRDENLAAINGELIPAWAYPTERKNDVSKNWRTDKAKSGYR